MQEINLSVVLASAEKGELSLRETIRGPKETPYDHETRLKRARLVTSIIPQLGDNVRTLVLTVNRAILQELLEEIRDQLRTSKDDRPDVFGKLKAQIITDKKEPAYVKLMQLRARIEESKSDLLAYETKNASLPGKAWTKTRELGTDMYQEVSQVSKGMQEGLPQTWKAITQGDVATQAILVGGATFGAVTVWQKVKNWFGGTPATPTQNTGQAVKKAGIATLIMVAFRFLTGGGGGSGLAGGGGNGTGGILEAKGSSPSTPTKEAPIETAEVNGHQIILPKTTVEDVGVKGTVKPKTKPITLVMEVGGIVKEWTVQPDATLAESDTEGLLAVTRNDDVIAVTPRKAGKISFSFAKDKKLPMHVLDVTPKPVIAGEPVLQHWSPDVSNVLSEPPSVHVVVLGPETSPKGYFDKEKDTAVCYGIGDKAMTEAELVTHLRSLHAKKKLQWVLFETQGGSSANPGFVRPERVCNVLAWDLNIHAMIASSYKTEAKQDISVVKAGKEGKDESTTLKDTDVWDFERKYALETVMLSTTETPGDVTETSKVFWFRNASTWELLSAKDILNRVQAMPKGDKIKPRAIRFSLPRSPGTSSDVPAKFQPAYNALKDGSIKAFGLFAIDTSGYAALNLSGASYATWGNKQIYLPQLETKVLLHRHNALTVSVLDTRDAKRGKEASSAADKAFIIHGKTDPVSANDVLAAAKELKENGKPKAIHVIPAPGARDLAFDPAFKALREASLNTFGYFLGSKNGHPYAVLAEEREIKDRREVIKPVVADTTPDSNEPSKNGFGDLKLSQRTTTWKEQQKERDDQDTYFSTTAPSAQIRVIPAHNKPRKITGGGPYIMMPIDVRSGGKTLTVYDDVFDAPKFVLPGSTTPVDINAMRTFVKKQIADKKSTWIRFAIDDADYTAEGYQTISSSDLPLHTVMEGLPVSYKCEHSVSWRSEKRSTATSHSHYEKPGYKTREQELEEQLNIFPVVMLSKESVPPLKEVAGDPTRNKVFLLPGESEPVDVETVLHKLIKFESNKKPKTLRLFYGQFSYEETHAARSTLKNLCLAKYGRFMEQDTFISRACLYERSNGKNSILRPQYSEAELLRSEEK